MATTTEAILGAVFLDRGEAAMQGVMSRLGLDHPLLQPVKSNIFTPDLFNLLRKNADVRAVWLISLAFRFGAWLDLPQVCSVLIVMWCERSTTAAC